MACKDQACIAFLQRALPRLDLRWAGFRKVRGTVCKRARRRIGELGLQDFDGYWGYLHREPAEWRQLEAFCRIPISRFYRDRGAFETLRRSVLPRIAAAAQRRGAARLRLWSVGSASGEEPYSLAILWRLALAPQFPELRLSVLASDAEPVMCARARHGCYGEGSLRDLPRGWRDAAFEHREGHFCLRPAFREGVEIVQADVRDMLPDGPFDLIACRNLVFTYFTPPWQRRLARQFAERLHAGGFLLLGKHEALPRENGAEFSRYEGSLPLYVKSGPEPPPVAGSRP